MQGALVSKLWVQNAANRSADFHSLFITVNAALGVHLHRPLIAKRAFQWFLNGLKQTKHMNSFTSIVDSGWHLRHVAFKRRWIFSHRFLAATLHSCNRLTVLHLDGVCMVNGWSVGDDTTELWRMLYLVPALLLLLPLSWWQLD